MSVTLRDYLAMSCFPRETWTQLNEEQKDKLGNDVYDMADRLIQIRRSSTKPVEVYLDSVQTDAQQKKAHKPDLVIMKIRNDQESENEKEAI